MGDDLIEGRYEIYGSTKSSYSRETTYTLLPAENVVENKLAEECEEDSSGEEPSAASPDTVMEGPDKSKDLEVLPDDDDFEDPGYEKIMLAQVSECKKEGEEESTYEVVAKVAQQVTLLKQASPEPINENQGDDNLQIEEIIETPCDSLERVEIPIIVEAKPIDMSHYDTLVPRPPQPRTVEQRKEPVAPRALEQRKEPQPRSPELRKEQPRVVEQRIEPTQPRVLEQRKEPRTAEQRKELPKNRATEPRKEVPKQPAIESRKSNLPPAAPPLPVMEFKEEVHTRPSVVETVKAINNRNLRSAQSLELLSNRLFNKRGEEANKNVVTREMVKARSVDRVNQDIKEHGKFKGKRVTYHDSVDSLARRDFYRSAESAVDQTYLEEEFSYEPESKAVSSKVVMRTRSLVSLDDEQGFRGQPRGKITTGPDGSFRIGGRKANSELNLTDDSDHEHEKPKPVHHKPIDSGEQLKKKKQEMFKERSSKPVENDRFFKEINGGFSKTTKEQAIDNLKRYLKENKIGLRDLLINNNIVIIEPYRDENDRDISEYSTTGRIKKDKKCRITGAHLKDSGDKSKPESNTLPRANKPYQPTVQRHFFYRCFKTNQKYVDDDLPDPDKVRYARELFQRVGKYAAPEDTILMLPIAARPRDPQGPRTTPEVRVVDAPINKKPQHEQLRRWTDTGSQSSGVSSDMSEESREVFSEEEHEHEVVQPIRAATLAEAQPVSPEVMKKIRACGTSVTYYGGRMIARCEGPARSPMTMTILDEIRTCDQRRPSQDYMGVKFRLIKSNSCGSRLELAGTQAKLVRQDIFGGKSLNEELAELAECKNSRMERNESKIGHGSWRQLIETRKHARTRAHNSTPRYPEMEFEEFQVLE